MAEYRRGNVFIRTDWLYTEGDNVPDHTHNFDHWTRITHGRARIGLIMPDGTDQGTELAAGDDPVLVPAEALHSITALEPNTRYECEFLHRNPTGDVVDDYWGWYPAYI